MKNFALCKYYLNFVPHNSDNTHSIVIETYLLGNGTTGGRMIESLLKTENLDNPKIQKWNQAISLLESMLLVMACNGVKIDTIGFNEGVRCYITNLRNNLEM